jgi:branched-subunit amino acid aminotransferase/4-amino-4-deoxychorismate lyase
LKNIGDNWATGSGLFETIRVEDGKVFALHRHHCRAKEAAEKLNIEIPTEEFVAEKSYEVISASDFKLGRIRWHFDGSGEFTISYGPYIDPAEPARLMIFDEQSNNYEVRNKEFPYKNLELLEVAKSAGFTDGIIITDNGQVAETSTATLLLKIDGQWVTPPLSSGILNGVVRALVLEAGLATVRRIERSELVNVESGLLLTSLRNAQNIGEISGRKLLIDNEKCAEIHELMNEFKGR